MVKGFLLIGESKEIKLWVESGLAKDNLLMHLGEMSKKSAEVKERGYTCGQCAAQPCFRHNRDESPAGLCYQKVLQCRDECDFFSKIDGSGVAPYFQIKGNCRKNGAEVLYGADCGLLGC